MKKTNKIIAVILAMVLAFSSIPLMASAAAIDDKVDTVEKLIQPDNLGNLVEWLLKNINNRKEEVVGTVLRLVFMFMEDESLQAKIGDTDLIKATPEKLADILVGWLDANLPTWTADLTTQSWWGTVTTLAPVLGVNVDLSTVKGAIGTLKDLCDVANNKVPIFNTYVFNLGTLNALNEAALEPATKKNAKNIDIVYALFQWLVDNTGIIKTALKGEIKLGMVEDIASGTADKINNLIKENIHPDAIKKMLCDAIELDYEAYKTYTADEIAAVAFLKLLTGKDTVAKDEASAVMNLSIYQFLENYAGQIYKNLLVGPLNTDVKELLVEEIKPLDDEYGNILDEVFNWDYTFTGTEFDAILGAGKGNMVAQLNNAVISLLKVILTPDAFTALELKEGGNENINENLAKAFRFILPKLGKLNNLGADLSGFTAETVANMSAEEMAVGVLKIFLPAWFKNANMEEINKVKSLEQLAVLAAKYAVTNTEWIPAEIAVTAAAKATNVEAMSDAACIDLAFEIGMEVAAKSLAYNKNTTYFELPADTSAWTAEAYLDEIADWALNFIDGLPASADKLSTERGKIDGEGGFFKLNVILDSLFDLSFISGCGNDYFAFDIETMLLDKFLGNLLNFDIESSVAILAKNEDASLFGKKINKAVIDLVDDLLTGLFDENYEIPATYTIGDVDEDGKLSASDARSALRASVNLETLTANQIKAADIDKSGKIEASDARSILRASVNLETLA